MKLKKLVSIIAAISVIAASSTGFAATWRHSRKGEVKLPSRAGENDYYYQDFIGVEPGVLPAGMIGSSNSNGTHSTEITDIGGVEKNCYVLEDLSHEMGKGSTNSSSISLNNIKGLVGVDIRFKYEKTGSSDWSSFVIEYHAPEGLSSRMYCGSANGKLFFNNSVLSGTIVPGNWYTLKCILDYDLQIADCELLDEANKTSKQVIQGPLYADKEFTCLSSINFRSSELGGKWYTDYIRVYKATEGFEEKVPDVKKGSAEPNKVPGPKTSAVAGRTNILMDGRYKFTTKAPKVADGNVLVTAKNVASFFNLAYEATSEGEIIKTDSAKYTVTADGIKKDASPMKLSAKPVKDGAEVFIPIGDIAKELGYEYSYDASANVATITTEEVK